MATQVSLRELGNIDFTPQAVIRKPIEYFATRLGIAFEQDTDDLDQFESAFLNIEDFPFALVRYRGSPRDTTTIYFARGVKPEAVRDMVEKILKELGLKPGAFEWISASSVPG